MSDFRSLGIPRQSPEMEKVIEAKIQNLLHPSAAVSPSIPTRMDQHLGASLGNFILYEYWQLRTEIRERMTSIRTMLAITFAGLSAILTITATLLSQTPKPYMELSVAWLSSFAVLIPLILMITSEQYSIVAISKYIRLHLETPFFEFALRNLDEDAVRLPLGWETYVLDVRVQAHRWGLAVKAHKQLSKTSEADNVSEDRWWAKEGRSAAEINRLKQMKQALDDDADLAAALDVSTKRDDFARIAITYTFRVLSSVVVLFSAILACFAYYTGQHFASSYFLAAVFITNVSAFALMHVLCSWYKATTRMSKHVDLPGMTGDIAARFLVFSKDGHKQ